MGENQDKAVALLGIAATKEPQDKPCPPDNVMSAFIENRVNSKTRTMMLSHLNQCEDCYVVWEQLGIYAVEENAQAVKQKKAEKTGFIQRLKNWYNDRPIWNAAIPGIALASLTVVLMVNRPDSPNQGMTVDPSIAVAALDADMLGDSISQYPLPWESSTFGFFNSTYTAPVKAVGAGLWNARNELINSKAPLPSQLASEPEIDWKNSEWRDYYAFGQWTMSAWVFAKAKQIDPTQWAELNKILQALEIRFKQQPDPEAIRVLQTIDKIKGSLNRLSKTEDVLAQATFLREIDLGLQKLFL
jgi:hypothetical protein